ncbi:MAG TPA: arsenite methyltransferase [Anaerolineae bacterium]|nr:arsenite methyltransferase [Anaerolineae bacterium]
MPNQGKTNNEIRAGVRSHYGEFAERTRSSCCSSDDCSDHDAVKMIYDTPEATDLPTEVTSLSAGCGDPVTLASLQPGEVVLDLGSGGGIDCFLAGKRVGEKGRVIGVDMTAEMIDKARRNKVKMGSDAINVEFRLGEIEHLPVADGEVDVVISNCVINLSPDKPQVFREAFRALKPGGRFAVTDIVTDGPLPESIQRSMSAWYGCVAGALDREEYVSILEEIGFIDVKLEPVKMDSVFVEEMVKELAPEGIPGPDGQEKVAYALVEGELKPLDLGDANPPFSARITAYKPT